MKRDSVCTWDVVIGGSDWHNGTTSVSQTPSKDPLMIMFPTSMTSIMWVSK